MALYPYETETINQPRGKMMKRMLFLVLGAVLSLMFMSTPAAAETLTPQPVAAHAAVKAEMPAPNFTQIIHTAEQANYATASASETRTHSATSLVGPGSDAHAFLASRDPLDDPHPDPDDGMRHPLALRDPGDETGTGSGEGEGEGSQAARTSA